MNRLPTWLTVLLLSAPVWAAPGVRYEQPSAHSTGADLLPYCEDTDMVVNRLRCDYYVQGVADLATIPRRGVPSACIPPGPNRTRLMEVATNYLKTVNPITLEQESAASLILKSFIKAFPCPKELKEVGFAAKKKGGGATISKEMANAFKKCSGVGSQEEVKKCVRNALK